MRKLKSTIFLLATIFMPAVILSQTFDVETIMQHGEPSECVNIVYMGDGFTQDDMNFYIQSINDINDEFFSTVPFSNYKNFFNVYAIKVISLESGTKHPRDGDDCPPEHEFPFEDADTYFDVSFDLYGIHRLTYPLKYSTVWDVANWNFPQYDQLMVIANTNQYGGGGGEFACGTLNSWSGEVMIHEAGHSFAGLADEYWAGEMYAGEAINMTNVANATPTLVKWKEWLGVSGAGIYQHCCGENSSDWYKPHEQCKMEVLGGDFCPICRQRIIEKVYELVNPILDYSPSNSLITITDSLKFELSDLLLPIPNTLQIKWVLNGDTIAQNIQEIMLQDSLLVNGDNKLEAIVIDTSFMLRVAPSFTDHINKVIWFVNKDELGIKVNSEVVNSYVKIFPNPVEDVVNIEAKNLQNTSEIRMNIYDLNGKEVHAQTKKLFSKGIQEQMKISHLPSGLYILKLETDKQNFEFPIVKK